MPDRQGGASRPGGSRAAGAGAPGVTPGPFPLYHQVYLVLRQRLLDGVYPQGEPVPGEIELARAFSVSRITVRRALLELADEGLIERYAGRGTFPTEGVERQGTVSGNLTGLLENLLLMGLTTQVRLLELEYAPPPTHVAALFAADGTLEVQRAVRVRSSDGVPFSYLTTYVPADIGRTFGAEELASQPLLALLERAGVQVASADQTVAAASAEPAVGDALGVAPGSALLKIVRMVHDERGRLVEWLQGLYRPDRYTYRMQLRRSDENGIPHWTPR